MSKHTPGPWHAFVGDDHDTLAVFGPDNTGEKPVVEWVGLDGRARDCGYKTCVANTHLIAAAPDLLEALEAMVDAFDYIAGDCTDPEQSKSEIEILGRAKTAISKTKGEW